MTKAELIIEKRDRIYALKRNLCATDFNAIKFAEGELTTSEFAEIREQRRAWRAEINALETEIKSYGG